MMFGFYVRDDALPIRSHIGATLAAALYSPREFGSWNPCPLREHRFIEDEAQSLRIAGSLARDIEKSNLVGTVVTGPLIRMPSPAPGLATARLCGWKCGDDR
jgi:hypothetical protein